MGLVTGLNFRLSSKSFFLGEVCFFFLFFFFFIPFIILALRFSCSLAVVTQIRGRIAGPPPPSPLRYVPSFLSREQCSTFLPRQLASNCRAPQATTLGRQNKRASAPLPQLLPTGSTARSYSCRYEKCCRICACGVQIQPRKTGARSFRSHSSHQAT